MEQCNTLIIGSSSAGMACAAHLKKRKIDYRLIEKEKHVAHGWRNHYERLHLHTNKSSSELPFVKFKHGTEKYPSRLQFVDYLEKYHQELGLDPEFETEVKKVIKEEVFWITETNKGKIKSKNVILCTGNTNSPKMIHKKGIDSFDGKIIHSSEYSNGSEFKDKRVLVIGFGNSACEIAIDLFEYGAKPALSVRSAVNVIPRDIAGIPVLTIGIAQAALPARWSDKLNKPLLDVLIGDIRKYGLKKLPYGPIEQIVKYHQIPLLDIGTMDLIKKGHIQVFGDIERIGEKEIHFEEEKGGSFDAIIMATGYETGLEKMVSISMDRKKDIQKGVKNRRHFGEDNLYFCGYYVSPTGMIREASIESKYIADAILKKQE